MPERVDLVLHIGTGKAGTTTVQHVLGRSRGALAAGGTLYPRAFGRFRHIGFGILGHAGQRALSRKVGRWRDRRRPDDLVVRIFDRFAGGSLVGDFLDAAGLDVDEGDLASAERRNESLCAEAVEVLRVLNLHQVETGGREPG